MNIVRGVHSPTSVMSKVAFPRNKHQNSQPNNRNREKQTHKLCNGCQRFDFKWVVNLSFFKCSQYQRCSSTETASETISRTCLAAHPSGAPVIMNSFDIHVMPLMMRRSHWRLQGALQASPQAHSAFRSSRATCHTLHLTFPEHTSSLRCWNLERQRHWPNNIISAVGINCHHDEVQQNLCSQRSSGWSEACASSQHLPKSSPAKCTLCWK